MDFLFAFMEISTNCKSGLNFQNSKHCLRVFTTILNVADVERIELWERGLHVTHGAGIVLKLDLKPKLQIVYSVSLSGIFTAPEQTNHCFRACLWAHLSESGQALVSPPQCCCMGDMDTGQRILQGPCGSTRAPKSPVTRNDEVYEQSDAQR